MLTLAFYVTALVIIGLWTALAIAATIVEHSRRKKREMEEIELLRRTASFPYTDADDAWYPASR